MLHFDAIFVLGPQGSGKGTQMQTLAAKLGFYSWDMGKILREHRATKTVNGETVGEIIDRGQLLTDAQLLGVVAPLIAAIPSGQGVVFDGIPRRLGQAEYLLNFLKEQGRKDLATVLLEVPDEESIKRLMLRAEVQGRADDTREAIEFRLQQYHNETEPMLAYMKEHTRFFEIDGMPSIPEVTASIFAALEIS